MTSILRTTLLALLALPLAAQVPAPGFSIAGGPILGFDSLKKATNNNFGIQVGADYRGHLPGTDVPARAGLALASFPGSDHNGLKTSLLLTQLHGDLLVPAASIHGYGIAGLSLNTWSMSRTGTENPDPEAVDQHFPVRDAKGVKLGLRLGLGFKVSQAMAVEVTFQQTELAGKDLQDPLVRQGGINPGWINLDLRYNF